jgi:hypothetical protein
MNTNSIYKASDKVEKGMILASLSYFIAQRPRLEFGNYGDFPTYNAEKKSITRDLKHAKILIDRVSMSSMPVDVLKEAFKTAYSGRLSWDGVELDYTAGQYWPTEYRKAVCAVCAQALWSWYGSDIPYDIENRGDKIRYIFHRMFPRQIANKWFR